MRKAPALRGWPSLGVRGRWASLTQEMGKSAEALESLRRVLPMQMAALGRDHVDVAGTLDRMAQLIEVSFAVAMWCAMGQAGTRRFRVRQLSRTSSPRRFGTARRPFVFRR